MMKSIITVFVFFAFFLGENCALNADDYIAYIEELSQNDTFLEEYAIWSLELFSQPDYLYGDRHKHFPCSTSKDSTVPTSVHALRPSDVKCVGAIGDSLTAGLGAHAHTPIGLLFENRGVSWSVGGDHTYTKILSLPNALRQYNSDLEGYSTKVSMMAFNGQNATHNRLNVAKSGDHSYHMPAQAQMLMDRMKQEHLCDWDNDWKVITLFVGGNDLCSFCEDSNVTMHTPELYMSYVRDTIDALYNAPLPRTLVNLVLVLDVRNVKDLNSGGFICQLLHQRTCKCAAFPTPEDTKTLNDFVPRYQDILGQLVDSGRYDGRDDFTVVIQPFMAQTQLPRKPDHKIDFSYFAPDCFHFSGKGHSQAALSLWNNMLEPVGGKQRAWHMGETLKCPSAEYPYIFTKKNSAKALEEYQRSTMAQSTNHVSSIGSSTNKPDVSTAEHHKHKHHKHHKSISNLQLAAVAGFFFVMLLLLVCACNRRQQIRVFIHGAGRRHLNGFTNPQCIDDNDDVEIWNQSNIKSQHSINNDLPKTHGTRISFE